VLWPADLARAAEGAPSAVADLYRRLARPYDEVSRPDGSRQRLSLPGGKAAADAGEAPITRYEQIALKAVNDFLAGNEPPPLERARAAEQALAAVLRFHLAVRERPAGEANPWQSLERRLADRLQEVRREELHIVARRAAADNNWGPALTLAGRLRALYPDSKQVRTEAAGVWADYAAERLKAGDYAEAVAYVERVERAFPRTPEKATALARELQQKAEALVKEARALPDPEAALAKLREARRVWPRLPGLYDEVLRRQGNYPVVNVGVRSLPEQLSPATAWTDPEKQAVELLFERLVREGYDATHGERYFPELAAGLPEVLPGGRRCRLRRDAYWSDGSRLTAFDVRQTALLLDSADLPGRTPQWKDLLERPEADHPFRIDLRFRQAYLDPLAPLTFHVLPQTFNGQALNRADAPAFAREPVGSGPYRYDGRQTIGGRLCAVFKANPHYGWRVAGGGWREEDDPQADAARAARPYIREIRFFAAKDPVADFRRPDDPLQLVLDLSADQVAPLKSAGAQVQTLPNRRVYFLAINHKVEPLGRSASLRRALAHGIDREAILTSVFRGGNPVDRVLTAALGVGTEAAAGPQPEGLAGVHRPLNGPYPTGCWACAPATRVPANLHDADRARSLLREAKEKDAVARVELTLKYPDDDPRVGRACQEIARQLAAVGQAAGCPVRITPVPLPPHALRQALEKRDYELAYHHLDYGSEAYWLWPLFDTRPAALAPGGANFLQYRGDAALESMFRASMSQRDFSRVREITQDIHAHLFDHMPLVPLWQLDTQLAMHPQLLPTHLDPLLIFSDVADWRLKSR
jgi:ABC-type transport system substrate-binding protein